MTLDLSKSRTLFRKDDGTLSDSTSDAKRITRPDLEWLITPHAEIIRPGFYIVGAKRESGYRFNECDIDYNTDGSERARTEGLWQCNAEEKAAVGMPNAVLTSPPDAVIVFRRLMERNLGADRTWLKAGQVPLVDAAASRGQNFDPTNPPDDAWFYLALSHNMGLPSAVQSIQKYGMNAKEWVQRNSSLTRQISYGNEIAAGAINGPPSTLKEAALSLVSDDKGEIAPVKVGGWFALAAATAWAISREWRR